MATVLVIDDDPLLRDILQEVLEAEGIEVHVAEDGLAGRSVLQRQSCDLVITDMVMPRQGGLETISSIRRSHPTLPILAISGGGLDPRVNILEHAILRGASQTLEKPFSVDTLVDHVQRLLQISMEPNGD